MHGHSNLTDPNEFATPESFAAAMKMSKYFKVNLDIGHFTAANFDAVAYIREHHADITNLHLKDRKKNQGDNVPWGQGDTPIREVLQLLKRERWPIRAYIEYEYRGAGDAGRGSEEVLRVSRSRRSHDGSGTQAPRHGPGRPGLRRRASHRRRPPSRLRRRRRASPRAARRRRARKADALGVPKAYGSYEALVADPDVHVVHNTTPNYLHVPVIRAALAHGKHVISDKPLATTAAEARALLRRGGEPPASSTR